VATTGVERKCPFCNSTIDEHVLLYGGSCPKCFGEIPGEEAATDPGAVVRARQAASDTRRMWWKALVPVALMVPVVFGVFVIAVGFVIWNRDPHVEVMNFDDDLEFQFEIVSAPEPGPEPVPVPGQPRPRPTNDGIADAGNPDRGLPDVVVAPRPSPAPSKSGGLSFDGLGTQAFREGEILSDPGQIFQMIKLKMAGYQGTLKECYDRRLKVKPGLEGRWLAKFVVGTDGFPKNVSFTGVTTKDAELEQCLANTVSRWRFVRISQPQPVEKSWAFRN
jgi:hypothetical protein